MLHSLHILHIFAGSDGSDFASHDTRYINNGVSLSFDADKTSRVVDRSSTTETSTEVALPTLLRRLRLHMHACDLPAKRRTAAKEAGENAMQLQRSKSTQAL
jgi:hypothetical protein